MSQVNERLPYLSPTQHSIGTDCTEKWLASRTCIKIGCGPLFGSEGFANPVRHNTKMVLRCPKDYFGSLLSRCQGHTSQVSWIAGLRALKPCRNKPEQTGWHKFFLLPKWRSDTSYVTWWSLEWHRLHRRMACFSNMHQNRVRSHFEAVVWILAKIVMATLGVASDPRPPAKLYPFLWPIGCGPLFGSERFAHPVPHSTKMVLRCLNDCFGSLLSCRGSPSLKALSE